MSVSVTRITLNMWDLTVALSLLINIVLTVRVYMVV